MASCRPLSSTEIDILCSSLKMRDRAILILGIKTGYRIQEILSLKVKDVLEYGEIKDRISVAKRNMKGKNGTRNIPVHKDVKDVLKNWLDELVQDKRITNDSPLFPSRKDLSKPISRIQYWKIFNGQIKKHKMSGKLGTHSMRKTFANKVYGKLNHDLVKTQRALGHININSTARYISFSDQEIEDAILD